MKGLRPLLRLDEKVAAEGRRLENLGAGSSRWGGLTLLVVAAILHGMMLMLPAVRVKATLPAASPAPDFPRVWRFEPPPQPAPESQPPTEAHPSRTPATDEADDLTPPSTTAEVSLPLVHARPLSTEPVPEPAPDVSMRMIASEMQANIPYPDAPPPPLEPGPPFAAPAPPREASVPQVILRSQPVYPIAARSLGAEGQVRLRVSVLPDGRVDQASVLDCSRPGVGFEAAALDAVKGWRYDAAPPATSLRSATVTIQFKKQGARP